MKFAQYTSIIAAVVLQCALSTPVYRYKPLTPEEAERLAAWTPESKQAMWELSGQYEGDMILQPGTKNGVISEYYRWSNREIPYEISNQFSASESQFIANAIETEFKKTCIKVRARTDNDRDYVYITGDNSGCWSYVGRVGGRQQLNLQRNGCLWHGTAVHELLHALGFYHQQSATERDDYVTIMWQNIIKGTESNFDKYPDTIITSFGEKYDYDSIMHYDAYAFSSNGQPTIVPKDPNAEIGQTDGLSTIDIAKLNKMYGCS